MSRFSAVINIPREEIITDPARFQGRQGKFSEETVSAIVKTGYDRTAEPIVVWRDPSTKKYIVISGHSRFEAARQLYESGQQLDLATIPAKQFLGDEDDAVDYATLESNRGSTEEGLVSDIQAYQRAIERGYNREKLLTIFKPETKLKKLRDLSTLAPKGRFIEALADDSARSFPYLERNARWVGILRRQLPALTNAHEGEMFRYFYESSDHKALKLSKEQFFDLVNKKANKIDFDADKPLALNKIVSANAYTDPINDAIRDLEKEIDKHQKDIDKQRSNIIEAEARGNAYLIPNFQDKIKAAETGILRKLREIDRLRIEAGKLERITTADLFSQPATTPAAPPPPPAPAAPGKVKKKKQAQLNAEIAAFVQRKKDNGEAWSLDDCAYAQQYTGDGGIVSGTRGMLYEYYTPHEIVSRMWQMAYDHGFVAGNILEPSCGTGRFLNYVDPTNNYVDAFEFAKDNDISYQIAANCYPWANIQNDYFESIFYTGNKRTGTDKRYDLVIGNPPYGAFDGRYAGKSREGRLFPGRTYDQYFLWAGIELLSPSGLLVMIIPSAFLDNSTSYEKFKDAIYAQADLLQAYRLPQGAFDHTQIQTDIVIFQKR